jgi:thiamine-phosphate pyrophosphorylase
VLRYAITDGARFGRDASARRVGLLADVLRWAAAGVEFVQLREKDLDAGELVTLSDVCATIFREHGGRTKLLVNHRADIAVAGAADGVHLTSRAGELTPEQVRKVFAVAGLQTPVISASCHTLAEVKRARDAGIDLILFGPVFEKRLDGRVVVAGLGLDRLQDGCTAASGVPTLALGGVTSENSQDCLLAGASGVAGIRLFQG